MSVIEDMDIFAQAKANMGYTVEIRRHIHRHPELSRMEFETLKYIRSNLDKLGITYVEVEDGGIFAFLGDESKGKTILLRADIDALPIQENPRNLEKEREFISLNDGVQHACGHDAHTAMLLTAGKILKEHEGDISGRVILMFERGEEGGGNLRQLLQYVEDHTVHIDGAHAIHVRPGVPAGKVVAIKGPIMSAGCGFDVTIIGRGGHGSRPDLANSPLDCFTMLYQAMKDIRLKHISPFENYTFSLGAVYYGNKGNIIPDELSFHGSARLFKREVSDRFIAEFKLLLEGITKAHHCTYVIDHLFQGLSPVVNHEYAAGISQRAIKKYLGEEHLIDQYESMMCSDSYSQLTRLYPSIMIHLGIDNPALGCGADLHTDLFDLDESAMPIGAAASVGYALEFLRDTQKPAFTAFSGTMRQLFDNR
jgi:amidohydrolase